MSNRLESLNSKKPSSNSKPSLRFKPKVVARKTKEELAKEAPTHVKQENGEDRAPVKDYGSTRGGRSKRGGRGNYAGTHLVSSGPLASGSVSMGNANGSKLGMTADRAYSSVSPTPEFLQNLKLKDLKSRTKSPTPDRDDESDMEEDATKINMNKEYQFADDETILFPVRPERYEPATDENYKSLQSKSQTPESDELDDIKIEVEDSPVKEEQIETQLEQIKHHKAQLESKITETVDVLDQEEASKLKHGHQEIMHFLTEKFNQQNIQTQDTETNDIPYTLFHLPKLLPEYHNNDLEETKEPIDMSERTNFASAITNNRGQIGQLNIHKSGKISINLGNNNNLVVSQGTPANFLQELMMLEMDGPSEDGEVEMMNEHGEELKGKLYRFGEVQGKIIGTPVIH